MSKIVLILGIVCLLFTGCSSESPCDIMKKCKTDMDCSYVSSADKCLQEELAIECEKSNRNKGSINDRQPIRDGVTCKCINKECVEQ